MSERDRADCPSESDEHQGSEDNTRINSDPNHAQTGERAQTNSTRLRAQEHVEACVRVMDLEDRIAAQDLYIQELLGQLSQVCGTAVELPASITPNSNTSSTSQHQALSRTETRDSPPPSPSFRSGGKPAGTSSSQQQQYTSIARSLTLGREDLEQRDWTQVLEQLGRLALLDDVTDVSPSASLGGRRRTAPPLTDQRFSLEDSQELWYACAHLDENWDRDSLGALNRNGKAKRIVIANNLGMEANFTSNGVLSLCHLPDSTGSRSWIDYFQDGYTPVMLAASRGSMEIAYALAGMGADIYRHCTAATMEYGLNALELCRSVAEARALRMEHLRYRYYVDRLLRKLFHTMDTANAQYYGGQLPTGMLISAGSGPGSISERIAKYMFSPKNGGHRPNFMASILLARLPSTRLKLNTFESWLRKSLSETSVTSLPRYLGHLRLAMQSMADLWSNYASIRDDDLRLELASPAATTTDESYCQNDERDADHKTEEVKTMGSTDAKEDDDWSETDNSSPSSVSSHTPSFAFSPQADPIIAESFARHHARLRELVEEVEPSKTSAELRQAVLAMQRKVYLRHNHLYLRKLRLEGATATRPDQIEAIRQRALQAPDISQEELLQSLLARSAQMTDSELAEELGVSKGHYLVTFRESIKNPRTPSTALTLRGLWQMAVDLRMLLTWLPIIQAKDMGIRTYLKKVLATETDTQRINAIVDLSSLPMSCHPNPTPPPRQRFDASQDPNIPGGPGYYANFSNAFAQGSPLELHFEAVELAAERSCAEVGVEATMYMLLPEEVDMFEANLRLGSPSRVDSLSIILDLYLALDDNRDGFVTRGGFDTSWNYFTVANARTREAIGQQGEAFTNLLWNAQRSDQDQDRHCVVS